MLIVIAIANAVLWSGLILALLLLVARDRQRAEAHLARLEARISRDENS